MPLRTGGVAAIDATYMIDVYKRQHHSCPGENP